MSVKSSLDQLINVSDLKVAEYVVFGAGIRGKRCKELLESFGLHVSFFCDNNPEKQGTEILGIPCFPCSKLEEKDYIIVVSPLNGEELVEELEKKYNRVIAMSAFEFKDNTQGMGYRDFLPIGHFYSLYPDLNEIKKDLKRSTEETFALGVDFNLDKQRQVLSEMKKMYAIAPQWISLSEVQEDYKFRYRYGNGAFDIIDAMTLFTMLMLVKPKRLIEVGSGWSSAVTLDVNEYYLNSSMELQFIEPYPGKLKSICTERDHIILHECRLQEIDISKFEELQSGDVLFIDSTHVSKIGSDVNYLFFEILPKLASGVYIHIHDICNNFEYPMEWIERGIVWNEAYLLRAFLQNNSKYEMIYYLNLIETQYDNQLRENWPFDYYNYGSSFWMKKL